MIRSFSEEEEVRWYLYSKGAVPTHRHVVNKELNIKYTMCRDR